MAKVQTVRGDISPDQLGVTLPHEHIMINLQFYARLWPPEESSLRGLRDKPVTMDLVPLLRRGARKFNLDDGDLSDIDTAVRELIEYKSYGGKSIVEYSMPGMGRDPIALRRISELTGLNIICSTGWYLVATHPPYVKQKTADELAEIMTHEINEGIGDTGIKAGTIGELGCSHPIPFHEDEKKVLKAACIAQQKTGVAFSCHPSYRDPENKMLRTDTPFAVLNLIEEEGADLNKFTLSHGDIVCPTPDHAAKLLDKGINMGMDCIGQEQWDDYIYMGARQPMDAETIDNIVELCKRGYEKQIVLSQDICWKHHLKKYGGYGYSHILEHIVPILRHQGVQDRQIQTMIVDNPKRILAF
jgi:phosphotriesterase-related protein